MNFKGFLVVLSELLSLFLVLFALYAVIRGFLILIEVTEDVPPDNVLIWFAVGAAFLYIGTKED